MLKKWIGAWGKDYQRSCLVQVAAVVIVIPLFTVLILVPLYLANRSGVTSNEALWIMVIPAAIFILLLIGGGYGLIYYSVIRRGKWLDQVFLPIGLEGRSFAVIGRQYHGTVDGREVDVFFSRGPLLTIYVGTTVKTRVSIADVEDVSLTLAGLFNKYPLELGSPRLTGYAHETEWGQTFVNHQDVEDIAAELIFEEHPFLIRQILLNPDAIMLRLYRSRRLWDFKFNPEQGRHWLEGLIRLVEIAEELPVPKEPIEESELSEKVRHGNLRTGRIVGIIVAALVGIPTCIAVVTVLALLYFEGGL